LQNKRSEYNILPEISVSNILTTDNYFDYSDYSEKILFSFYFSASSSSSSVTDLDRSGISRIFDIF